MKKLLLSLATASLFGNLSAQVLAPPVDFESGTISYTFVDFDGGQATVINNPQVNGINTSSKVGQMVKNNGQVWGGSYIQMDNPIDFSTNKIFKMKVYSPLPGRRVLLKVEDPTNGGIFFEKEDTSTVANAWEELSFDFTAINTSNTYQKIILIWELGIMGDGSPLFTYLFDDIQLVAAAPSLQQIDLPVTFEDSLVDYTMTDFGGNASSVIVDPVNPPNKVAEVIKSSAAQLWAGTTIGTPLGFANPMPFSAVETRISVKVWSPDAGIPIRLKAEDHTNPTISVETETLTTVAGQWETLVFDFSNEVNGTAAINFGSTYDMLSIFFDFGTDGATNGTKTYYFDDVEIGGCTNTSSSESQTACDAYTWNGNTYTASGTYTYMTTNAGGCDSTVTLTLVVDTSTTSSITETALDVYTAPSGATHTSSGIYTDTIPNAAGCDSIITIDLTMNFTGINENERASFELFPNPSTEHLSVVIGQNHLGHSFTITDQVGRVVLESEVNALKTEWNISELESGLYYVRIGRLKAVKFVKQ